MEKDLIFIPGESWRYVLLQFSKKFREDLKPLQVAYLSTVPVHELK